jgi:Na+-transporting methylmalonyl-CoA/oxaloacetate decarboxylase gamma subunit
MEIFRYDGGIIMKNVWFLALMGISIVFLLLIILMTIIWLFRFFFKSKNSNNLSGKSNLEKPQKVYIKPPQVKRIENNEKRDKRDEEELFAIVSAITSYLTDKEFKIESIKEVSNKELESKGEIKTRWMKHEPSIFWKPYYKKRWR